ncbi:hypothetical protein [Oceanicoccus sp. KOV_DT_Chl]|uniref:hypothetical protein n=1 Tax=Oceanicoccus sp. KOV_DT_Chl TaxID=1904639 RepID=UPI001F3C9670|nr:hypothetical protein [Oceanicoccus sp. KOV_DT_Chl]
MPTDAAVSLAAGRVGVVGPVLPLAARRCFRFAAVVALSVVIAYGLALPLPFFALYLPYYWACRPRHRRH